MKTRKNQEGQAIVEMTVALIGMATVFCGLILVANLTTSNIDNVLSARGNADENGDSGSISLGGDQGFSFRCWDVGADRYQYSPDDEQVGVTIEDSNDFKGQLVVTNNDGSDFKMDSSDMHAYVDSESDFKTLMDYPLFLDAADLTSGKSSKNMSIDDMPLAAELFLDNPGTSSIALRDTLYMPFMKDAN